MQIHLASNKNRQDTTFGYFLVDRSQQIRPYIPRRSTCQGLDTIQHVLSSERAQSSHPISPGPSSNVVPSVAHQNLHETSKKSWFEMSQVSTLIQYLMTTKWEDSRNGHDLSNLGHCYCGGGHTSWKASAIQEGSCAGAKATSRTGTYKPYMYSHVMFFYQHLQPTTYSNWSNFFTCPRNHLIHPT